MMDDITELLKRAETGDPSAANELVPLVYNELRQLASIKLSHEENENSLQATALVNEAYLRLIGNQDDTKWNGRGHFFGAAALAMRRILVERARQRASLKAGGNARQVDMTGVEPELIDDKLDLLALDEALSHLESHDLRAFQVVHLRFFAGLTIAQVAEAMGIATSTVENDWAYAKSWLKRRLKG